MTHIPFETIPIVESNEPLVDLEDYPFVIQAAYYNQGISKDPLVRLRKGAADKLLAAQESFNGMYKIKVWDGYRPRTVQAALYDAFYKEMAEKHPEFTAEELHHHVQLFITKATNPHRVPPHATGGTVDLTLVDTNGDELDMGTAFDHFGPEAAALYYESSDNITARDNRRLLRNALVAQGFAVHDDEWWHFDYGNQVWAYRTGKTEAIYGEASL